MFPLFIFVFISLCFFQKMSFKFSIYALDLRGIEVACHESAATDCELLVGGGSQNCTQRWLLQGSAVYRRGLASLMPSA